MGKLYLKLAYQGFALMISIFGWFILIRELGWLSALGLFLVFWANNISQSE